MEIYGKACGCSKVIENGSKVGRRLGGCLDKDKSVVGILKNGARQIGNNGVLEKAKIAGM